MSFHSEEFPRSHERRRFIRQRVRSLAYLDVGPDNGGIVLNLSENGIALQAVNPFIDQTRVSLRIQLPTSRKRIETSAKITWHSESKREAGLQFLELPEGARAEIADWVSAEADAGEQRPLNDSVSPHISDVEEFPSLESPLPIVATASHELTSPADPIAKRDETSNASVRELNSASRQFFASRFRKWWAIAAICGCTAFFFLFLGMAITRRLLNRGHGKLNPHENARAVSAASPSLIAPGATSQSEVSDPKKTRHSNAGRVANASNMESPRKHNDQSLQADLRDGEAAFPAAKLPLPIDPPRPTAKSYFQNESVPSWPVLSVQPPDAHNLTADPLAVKASSPASANRRNDCYLIYRVEPLYPREAKEHRVEGTVTIHLLIGADGRVRSLRELSGPGPLVPAALAAARDWRFIPALLNGVPIDAEQDVNIAFRLPR
jgi:TonB family protein